MTWLVAAFGALSMPCIGHNGLPGADQSGPIPPAVTEIDAAIAAGDKEKSTGRFEQALEAFARAEQAARKAGDSRRQSTALLKISACEIHLFRYGEAVASAESAREIATAAKYSAVAGGAAGNLATTYSDLGDFTLAEKEAAESVRLLRDAGRPDYLAKAWLNYAWIQMGEGKTAEGKQSSERGIAVARSAHLPQLEALGWDYRGTSLLFQGDLTGAEAAIRQGLEIREKIRDVDGSALSKEHLAELELRRQNFRAALKLIDEAFATPSQSFQVSPQYYPIHIRGQILLALGRTQEALAEFYRAVNAASRWREGALPGDATNTRTVALLDAVYRDYSELAAEVALQRHDAQLSRRAFEALAANRAASLREQMLLVLGRKVALPPRYFELLSQLQAVQARVTLKENAAENQVRLDQIRLQLSELENTIGIKLQNVSSVKEKNRIQNSLRDIQVRLGPNDILLSYCLGKEKSFLWAITGDAVNLYRLAPERQIEERAGQFLSAVQGRKNTASPGTSLSSDLFGAMGSSGWRKQNWLIAGDGVLLNGIPFSALPDREGRLLIENHTIRSLPSELLLVNASTSAPRSRFIGVADPIYNLADSRRPRAVALVATKDTTDVIPLGRLAGSGREIQLAAKLSGLEEKQLLTGNEATGAALAEALKETPEILHFAVHVVSPEGKPQDAALALSLTRGGMPELLTREAIAGYRVPGSLVVLSGCSSDQGQAIPGAGLIGLSRSWLLAGAAAVVVSAWPTPDDSGKFFSVFYSQLRQIPAGAMAARAALALERAQMEMQKSNGYRSSPSFWAAYSIVSKE